MADRCAVLRAGRVEQVDEPRRLYERPANRFVADFMGGANLIPGRVLARDGARVRVRTACGEWLSEAVMGPADPGAEVMLAIRPEALRLGQAAPAGRVNAFSGRLADQAFLGETEETWVRLSDGTLLKTVGLGLTANHPDPQGAVTVEAAPEDVVTLSG